jgi:hypothetical protein
LPLAPLRENAIVEELSQCLDDCYEELLSGGATESEAYQQALALNAIGKTINNHFTDHFFTAFFTFFLDAGLAPGWRLAPVVTAFDKTRRVCFSI